MKAIAGFLTGALLLTGGQLRAETVLRVGFFPNVTHAQGVIGSYTSSQGKGWFEQRLGPDVKIEWFAFNAGPSAMEALFAGSIDLTYVGPNPALNGYIRSKGEDVRIVCGSALGGAALLVQPDGRIKAPMDFKGKRVGTPQFGNTQDVACRAWLKRFGFKVTPVGGDVLVIPTANPDQLMLFQTGKLDAVWTVEPWVSRLESEAGANVFLRQNDVVTTMLVASVKALRDRPGLVRQFVAAHRELTDWINTHSPEARQLVADGLTHTVHRAMPQELVDRSWHHLTFANDVTLGGIQRMVMDAENTGFIRAKVDLGKLMAIQK